MATKTICDNCKKTKVSRTTDGWFNISVDTDHRTSEEFKIKSAYNRWDLCPKCAKNKINKILNIIEKK